MCRRYTLTVPGSRLARIPWIDEFRTTHEPRYNIAPGQFAPVVTSNRRGKLILESMRWGLVPSWAEDLSVGYRLATVPVQDVATHPAFQTSFRARRCLLLADGFYMWQGGKDGARNLFWYHRPRRALFPVAGVWEEWASERSERSLFSFAMVTVSGKSDRSATEGEWPAVLEGASSRRWMDLRAKREELLTLPWSAGRFLSRPVSPEVIWRVGESPECIDDTRSEGD